MPFTFGGSSFTLYGIWEDMVEVVLPYKIVMPAYCPVSSLS